MSFKNGVALEAKKASDKKQHPRKKFQNSLYVAQRSTPSYHSFQYMIDSASVLLINARSKTNNPDHHPKRQTKSVGFAACSPTKHTIHNPYLHI
jgi:hypothetical protein